MPSWRWLYFLVLPPESGAFQERASFGRVTESVMDAAGRIFVGDETALVQALCALKNRACPFCKRIGTLNRHSHVGGNNPEANQGRIARGQRAFCSNRERRAGCGRTFMILFAFVLPRYTFNARLLRAVPQLRGTPVRAARSRLIGKRAGVRPLLHS